MAMALRPRASPSSISSRYGSQALAEGLRVGGTAGTGAGFAPGSVIASLAGFAAAESPGRARVGGCGAGSGETSEAGFPTPKSVITSLAGFGTALRPQPPGGRIAIPAAFK